MLIANINTTNSLSSKEVAKLTSDESMSNNIGELHKAPKENFRLNPVYLEDFSATFTQMLFYCHKPGGNTIHLYTEYRGNDYVSIPAYFMLKTNTKPNACGSFRRFSDDTSTLSKSCDEWGGKTWGGLSDTGNRLYNSPFYIQSTNRFSLYGNHLQCDDGDGNGNAGVWKIFVR